MKFLIASVLAACTFLVSAHPNPDFYRAVDGIEFYRSGNGIVQRNVQTTSRALSNPLQKRKCAKSSKQRHREFAHPHQRKPTAEIKKTNEPKKVESKESSEARVEVAASKKEAQVKVQVEANTVIKTNTVKISSSNDGKGFFAGSGATSETTKDSGPNGAQWWLNSGFGPEHPDSGWNPPFITLKTVKMLTLDEALKMPNSVYAPCAEFVETFDSLGASTGLGSLLLAAIAMQESTCRPDVKGDNGGAWGLMQITSDKCGGAPNGNCNDPYYNIKTGAEYLKARLDENGGDLLVALGQYNGWRRGLTYNQAIAIKGSCCACQNNGDYMQQMLNGWLQGLAGYNLGTVRNLDSCH